MKEAPSHFIEFYMDIRSGVMRRSPEPQKIQKLKSNLKMTADSKTLKTIMVVKIKMKSGYEYLCEPILITSETINGANVLIASEIK